MVPHPPLTADTWATAASGRDGFYARTGPRGHFTTSASLSPLLSAAVASLLAEAPEVRTVIDVGAGDGQLLSGLVDLRPDLALWAVDVRDRPPGLDARVGWLRDIYDVAVGGWTTGAYDACVERLTAPALVVATELLDDLPLADVGATGAAVAESTVGCGAPNDPDTEKAAQDTEEWVRRWWPAGVAEVGLHRDRAWAALVASLRPTGGLALMVDYGHLRADRPEASTLTSFRDGRQRPAAADAAHNLTAHVAVDAVAAAGERCGATTLGLIRQRDALRRWWPSDPESGDPLADLVRCNQRQILRGPGLGDHWWLLQQVPRLVR